MKLDELIRNHVISDYMYIEHLPEEDEKKKHIHLWIKPNKLLDTMDLQEFFKEDDPNNKKPLGCKDFRFAKTDDWILYNQHFQPYLAYKGEDRGIYYQKSDFNFYDEDQFDYLYNHAMKGSEFARRYQILQRSQERSAGHHQMRS